MVARVARFEAVNVEAVERTMAEGEAILRPIVEALPGYAGHLELLAPDGQVLSVTFFDTGENAAAAERTFDEELPRRLGGLFTDWEGRRVAVDRFEVLTDVRR